MNRRAWWTALLAACGVAKAQTDSVRDFEPMTTCASCIIVNGREVPVSPNGKRKPVNNECPVCGTMAKPFKRPEDTQCLRPGFQFDESTGLATTACFDPVFTTTNRVTCEWCKCVFEQSEEV